MRLTTRQIPILAIDRRRQTFSFRHREPGQGEIRRLARSIRKQGLLHPPVVREVRGGAYELVSGHRRHDALLLLLREDPERRLMTGRVAVGGSEEDLLRLAFDENERRRNPSHLERAFTVDEIRRERGRTYKEIARLTGISPKTIQRYRRMLDASERVLDAVREERISYSHAALLARLPADLQERLLEKTVREELSVRELSREIRSLETEERSGIPGLLEIEGSLPPGARLTVRPGRPIELSVELGRIRHGGEILATLRTLTDQIEIALMEVDNAVHPIRGEARHRIEEVSR